MKHQKYIFIPLFLILVSLFVNSVKTNKNKNIETVEKWTQQESDVIFFSKEDTISFLTQDRDKYVKGFTSVDLYARKSNDYNDYISRITKCASTFTNLEKSKLIRCAKLADNFLKSYIYYNKIQGSDIAKIPWKFAMTRKNNYNQYEEGLPHTREDIIFLAEYVINDNIATSEDDMILVSTLIHEKVHIYQRQNEKIMDDVIEHMGYKVANAADSATNRRLKRNNPDTNKKDYYNANDELIIFKYNSDRPKNINDVNDDNFSSEHPYEKMAYDIANEYIKHSISNITNKII